MKRNKVVLMTAIAVTSITILGGCGKSTEDTMANANTEALLEETEEIETETETEESIMDENGNYKDFAEDYVTYTTIEEATMYGISAGNMYENPNMTKGEFVVGGRVDVGSTFKVNATCEIDNILYYRTAPNDRNQMFIIEADLLSDSLPSDESNNENADSQDNNTTQNSGTDSGNTNTDNTNTDTYTGTSDLPPDVAPGAGDTFSWDDYEDVSKNPAGSWDNVDQSLIDAAGGMTWQ